MGQNMVRRWLLPARQRSERALRGSLFPDFGRREGRLRAISGFTVIELLIVAAVLALLLALLIPAVAKMRESSRNAACKNNLRQLGIGFYLRSGRHPDGRLCSGAFDPRREGCIDRWGWVADQINTAQTTSDSLVCPSSPLRVNEKLIEAYGLLTNDDLNDLTGGYRSRATDGMCGQLQYRGIAGPGDPAEGYASTDPVTEERRDLVSRYFIARGYNSNYVTSWFLIHTAPRVRYQIGDQTLRTNGQAAQQGLKGKRETLGPLSLSLLSTTDLSSAQIPLVGDGAPGDIDEALSPVAFAYDRQGHFAGSDPDAQTFCERGALTAESVSEGPSYYHTVLKRLKLIGSYNSRLNEQWACDLNKDCEPPTGGAGNKMYLQSTRCWFALHGGSQGFQLNLLFADGSTRQFQDRNDDLLLNPGFPVPDDLSEDKYSQIGYRDSTVEIHRAECFSGVFIAPKTIRWPKNP